MVNVSLFINSSKLRDAVVSNFDLERVQYTEEKEWSEGSDILFDARNDLIIIDFNAIKNQTLDVFVTINTLCENNGIDFVLLVKRTSSGLRELENKLNRLVEIVETHAGRKEFDRALRRIVGEVAEKKHKKKSGGLDEGQKEINLSLEDNGNVNDTAVFNLLFAILIRKATGVLSLINGARSRRFSFRGGAFVSTETTNDSFELVDAMGWKTGTYEFEKQDRMAGRSQPLEGLLATGVRDSLSNIDAMRALMSEMNLFPALTSRFEDSRKLRDSMPELTKFTDYFDRGLTWQQILAEEGEEFFKVAYFAIQTYLVDSSKSPKTVISISWSQETRRALERGERQKIEKTTAFKTAQNPETVERELRIILRDMEYQTPYEIFGVWKGCGKNIVSDRFYELVKQRHPDLYGNVSVSVKGYAQKIFIGVKKAYVELLSLEKFDDVQTAGEPSFVLASEASEAFEEEVILSESINPDIKVEPAKTRSTSDVQTKMGQLSAMRKKRSRRRSLAESKKRTETLPPVSVSETERILAEVSEISEQLPISQPVVVDERQTRLDRLKSRARKKNPNAISEAQELFSEGYQLYREKRMDLAHEKFEAANALDSRALHLAFFAYTSFLIDPGTNAENSEILVRKAIEMNDKQTQPDALFFMAQILKHRGDDKNAVRFFEKAFALNPTNREAEREIRLSRSRNVKKNTEPGDFIKKLFKK